MGDEFEFIKSSTIIQIKVQTKNNVHPIINYAEGGMDATCSAGGYGHPLSTTEDFCYFLSLKSKASLNNHIKITMQIAGMPHY
jgi:hypothetical protein